MSKVLVVDDEKGYREKLEHMLEAEAERAGARTSPAPMFIV